MQISFRLSVNINRYSSLDTKRKYGSNAGKCAMVSGSISVKTTSSPPS
jgi:hypothetical protein